MPDSHGQGRMAQILRRAVALVTLGAIGWLMITVNLADYFAQELNQPEAALRWRPGHPHALAAVAYEKVASRQPDALEWVERAREAYPTDGSLYVLRAFIALRAGDEQAVRAYMAEADRLAPTDPEVQRNLATLAAALDDPGGVVRHWARVADRPRHRREAIARLAALAESPRTAGHVRLLVRNAPDWWSELLIRLARHGRHPESVEPLLRVSRQYDQAVPEEVTRTRIQRLQRAGDWRRAYLLWIDSLHERQLGAVGFVYNGRFRLPLQDADFGWRREPIGGVRIDRGEPEGVGNGWALYAHFPVGRYRFRHVHQKLLLPPGDYRLTGEVRTARMQTRRGFSWVIRCLGQGGAELGRSEPVADSPDWRAIELAFRVPSADCPAQDLRLILDGRHGREFDVSGTFWTRDLAIERHLAEGPNE